VNDTSKPAEPAFQQEDRSRPRRARCRQYPRVLLALAALLSLFVVNVGAQNPADRGGSTNPGNPAAGAQGQPAQGQPAQGQPAQGQPGAAGQGNQDPIRIEGDFVVFSVDENQGVPFKEFIKFAQIVTKKTFVVDWENDPAAGQDTPNSRINLLGALRIRKENFYDFFQTMMYIKGWACVPRGTGSQQFIHIIYQQGAKNAEIKKGVRFVPVDDIDRYRDQTGTFIITTVTMEHINAQLASQTLRTVFSAGGTMEQALSFGNSKKLLLTGFGPSVYTQVQLLKLVDIEEPRAEANFRLIPLQYSSVEEIEPIITELMNERAKTPPAAGGAQNIQRPEDIVPVVVRQFAQDNALIVYAHESRIREIETMVAKLDSKANSIEGNYHVYPLKHTLAKETREVVHNFLDAANNAQQRAGAGQGGAAGGAANREPRPVVIADEKSNRLLISATQDRVSAHLQNVDRGGGRAAAAGADRGSARSSSRPTQDVESPGHRARPASTSAAGTSRGAFGLHELRPVDGLRRHGRRRVAGHAPARLRQPAVRPSRWRHHLERATSRSRFVRERACEGRSDDANVLSSMPVGRREQQRVRRGRARARTSFPTTRTPGRAPSTTQGGFSGLPGGRHRRFQDLARAISEGNFLQA
jgi:hypothetical protein